MYYRNSKGVIAFMRAGWTDGGPKDPFVELARGQAIARIEDLLALSKMTVGDVK